MLSAGTSSLGGRVQARVAGDPAVRSVRLLDDDEPYGPQFDGASVWVHLAFDDNTEIDPTCTARTNVEGMRRRLEAAAAAGVRQIVVLSSATVYGAWPNNPVPLTEEAPLRPNPEFSYAVQHATIERIVADWADDHPDATVAVVRPAVGLAEGHDSWIARSLAAAAGIRAGEDDPPVQFVHLDDLAAAIDCVRRSGESGVFNVAPDGWIPGDAVRALAGDKPRLELPARLAAQLAEWSWELRLGPIPPGLVPYTQSPWVVANDRLRAIGWVPKFTNEEAFVEGTEGTWWSMMSPKRKQELALGVSGVTLLMGAAGVGWLVRRAKRAARV